MASAPEQGHLEGPPPSDERDAELRASIDPLPKAELHLHLDGSLRPETAIELAAEIGMALDIEEARRRMVAPPRTANQAELLRYFDLPIALLQTRSALERAADELVEQLADDGVTYAEIRWAPRLHLEREMSLGAVIEAVASGCARARARIGAAAPTIGLIVTAMRQHPPAANVRLAQEAGAFGEPVVGFDLAGPEAWPAPPHTAAFIDAAGAGLGLTAHAGEVAGPDHIREVLDLGVSRVAHGATAVEDASLVQQLRDQGVTLDMCPTSNVQAAIVTELASHPLARLHRLGVSVTCSTDDRVVSNTTLSQELSHAALGLGLTRSELADIAVNAFRRGFAPTALMEPLERAAATAWGDWARRTRTGITAAG